MYPRQVCTAMSLLLVFAVSARAVLAAPNNQQVPLGAFIPGNKDKVPLQAVIKTNKNKYVVGEPVFVTAMVQNIANKPLKVLSDILQWQMDILIAKEGGKFQRFRRGQADLVYKEVSPAAVELKPGEKKYYVFLVLYTYYRDNREPPRLAFPRPGKYTIKVRTRVYGEYKNRIESNTIQVTVLAPKGVDLDVWKQLNDPEYLFFLQSWEECPDRDRYALRTATVLNATADSSYHVGLRAVLRQYYAHNYWRLPWQKRALICRALNLQVCSLFLVPDGPKGRLWWDIRVRERQVSFSSGRYEISKVLEKATWQTGVPLDPGDFTSLINSVELLGGTYSLEQFMQMLAQPGWAVWVRRGDGYRLEALPAVKK